MLSNEQQQEEARDLFFQSGLTQQQIADQVNVSRKTIGQWMQKGRWREMKKAAAQAPGILLQDFYDQLTSLNDAICTRKEAPYPTAEESVVQRRLMMSIKSFERQPASNYIQIFTELLNDIVTQDLELAQKMVPYTNSIVQRMAEKAKMRTDQHMFLTDEDPEEEQTPIPVAPMDSCEGLAPSPLMERAGVRCNPNVTSCNLTENSISQEEQGFDDDPSNPAGVEHFSNLPHLSEEGSEDAEDIINDDTIHNISSDSDRWGEIYYPIPSDPDVFKKGSITVVLGGSPLLRMPAEKRLNILHNPNPDKLKNVPNLWRFAPSGHKGNEEEHYWNRHRISRW